MVEIASARLNQTEVVKVYTKTAPVYDLWARLTETKARGRSLELAGIRNGESVLEVAVGTGATFWEIVKANSDGWNVGIDLTPAMLQRAKARLAAGLEHDDNYSLTSGDAYNLTFPDNSFDLLVNNYMFDLMPQQHFETLLAGFRRVLKPSGRLLLVNMTTGQLLHHRFWEFVYHINPNVIGGCRGVRLSDAVQNAGFRGLHRETVAQFGFPSEIITARA